MIDKTSSFSVEVAENGRKKTQDTLLQSNINQYIITMIDDLFTHKKSADDAR